MRDLSKNTDKNISPIKVKSDKGEETVGYYVKHERIRDYVYQCFVDESKDIEHVSVTLLAIEKKRFREVSRTATWQEMCFIKDLFFNEDEEVIQIHRSRIKGEAITTRTLHLWKYVPVVEEVSNPDVKAEVNEVTADIDSVRLDEEKKTEDIMNTGIKV